MLTRWLEARACEYASRPGASEADQIMCICVSAYASMIRLMDESDYILTLRQALHFKHLVLKHLQSYVWLHKRGMDLPRHLPGRRCYLFLPKLHHLWHLAFDVASERLNPRSSQLMSAESFIGVVGRIARSCHRATVSQRTLQRYLVKLQQKISEVKASQ